LALERHDSRLRRFRASAPSRCAVRSELSVAVVTGLAKAPAANFAVFKIFLSARGATRRALAEALSQFHLANVHTLSNEIGYDLSKQTCWQSAERMPGACSRHIFPEKRRMNVVGATRLAACRQWIASRPSRSLKLITIRRPESSCGLPPRASRTICHGLGRRICEGSLRAKNGRSTTLAV
jgi:hypothetical protein